jgi:hypothetical protein
MLTADWVQCSNVAARVSALFGYGDELLQQFGVEGR